jgi:hypothetical protein
MIAIWPIAHAIYLISTEQPALKTVPVPDFLDSYFPNLSNLEAVADFLLQEIEVTMNNHASILFTQDLGFLHSQDVPHQAAQLNQNVLCVMPFLYLGLAGNANHLAKAKRVAELLKSNLVFTDKCHSPCPYDIQYDAPIFLNGPNNSFWYYTNGWYLEQSKCLPCPDNNSFDYTKAIEASEDVSHAINLMYFIYEAYKQGLTINNNNDLFLNDAEMEKFRRMFLNNIYVGTNSESLTFFNLRVDGTNYALSDDDGQNFNDYKNLISAFMPFYEFDYNGTVKSTTTYDLILQTMKNVWEGGNPNNPNNPRSALDFLSSSAIGGYGFSQVVSAQWDKECVDLTLFNRNLTYDQDFHAKHNLTINTIDETPTEFLYDSDLLYKPIPIQKSITLPVYQSSNFTIQSGVTANITAGNYVSLKGEVYFKSGSEVSIRTINSNCFSGGRYGTTNINYISPIVPSTQKTVKKDTLEQRDSLKSQVNIFPNPFFSTLIIEILFLEGSTNFMLQNSMGQIMEKGSLVLGKNNLNLSHLNRGLYFINIFSKGKSFNQKLIKY